MWSDHLEPLKVDGTWPVVLYRGAGFRCVHCGEPARRNPVMDTMWGCLKCQHATAAISQTFRYDVAARLELVERHLEAIRTAGRELLRVIADSGTE